MKVFLRWLLVFGLGLGVTANSYAQEAASYVLGVGDVLNINVYDEPDMSVARVLISDTGTIAVPVLGEVKAIGKTPSQLKQDIIKGLVPDYLVNPIIDVTIVEYRPYFITGEVNKPGQYAYSPGLTLRQAISIAGNLTERGSEGKMTVVPAGKTPVDPKTGKSKDAVKVGMDYLVKPGDTITIDQSFF
jgi:polysaccharide export outer membrane protein